MFGQSRWVTAAIVAGVVLVLVIFGLMIRSVVSVRTESGDFENFVTSSQTTVYVNPEDCPLCQANGNGGVLGPSGDPNQTPDVSGQGSAGSAKKPGFFASWFSGVPRDLPEGYAAKDLSPQFRKVRIAGVRTYKGNSAATNADTVTLTENIGGSDAAINITGWRLQANQGSYAIQRAAKVYRTSGASLTNVTLANGQSAQVYSGSSAVNANFMGNTCTGYLSTQYQFVPKLPGACVKPTKNEIATFSGLCQEYIMRLPACQPGDPNDSRIPAGDSACRTFVSNLNYDGCVRMRESDPKFLSNVWHVWSGRPFLDSLHDRVLLLDTNGKLVDWYLY